MWVDVGGYEGVEMKGRISGWPNDLLSQLVRIIS